jgi:hypothetical protein
VIIYGNGHPKIGQGANFCRHCTQGSGLGSEAPWGRPSRLRSSRLVLRSAGEGIRDKHLSLFISIISGSGDEGFDSYLKQSATTSFSIISKTSI